MACQRRSRSVHILECKIPVYGPRVRTDATIGFKVMELRQIDAGDLNVDYVESGPAHGPVAVLLHGWPCDVHSYGEVMPLLASSGYRVIVLSATASRSYSQSTPSPNGCLEDRSCDCRRL